MNVITSSSAKAEYQVMPHTSYEMLWVHSLLHDLGGIDVPTPTPMFFDNQTAIFTANNLVFHEQIRYIEVDCNFV